MAHEGSPLYSNQGGILFSPLVSIWRFEKNR
jgi:hypothetical protein